MEDEDMSERRLKLASIMDRVRNLKTKYQNGENLSDEVNFSGCTADTTDHSGSVSHFMMTENHPEDWWSFLLKIEKSGDPQQDYSLLNKLTDFYSRAVTVLTAEEYSQNESYAKILVRFAELKAFLNPEEARDQFQISRLNCKTFAFVHIAFAQFELSQGNFKKSKQILQKAIQCCAIPVEMLEMAMQNLYLKKMTLLSEDKENVAVTTSSWQESNHRHSIGHSRSRKKSDSSGELSSNVNSYLSRKSNSPEDSDVEFGQKPFVQLPNKIRQYGRVPIETVSLSVPNVGNTDVPNVIKRETSGSMHISAAVPSFNIPKPDGDDDSYNLGNVKFGKDIGNLASQFSIQDNSEAATDSTLTLLNKTDSSVTVNRKETEVMDVEPNNAEVMDLAPNNPELMDQEPNNTELYHQSNNGLHEPDHNKRTIHSSEHPEQAKLNSVETPWKVPQSSCHRNMEGKQNSCEGSVSKRVTPPGTAPKRNGPAFVCDTPSNTRNDYMSCFRTPVVNEGFPPVSQNSTPYSQTSGYLQSKPQTPAHQFQNLAGFQITTPQTSKDVTMIKGRLYSILRQIGTGGSSKVFQVMDERKRLYAVKYVNLEEADQLTIESYKNEIDHLIKLQPHSDKIIRLYDYEITGDHIHMVMECGNIDLNSWLRKKKTISPWERKSYWKNMLEAVHTIHQHGIVHSDLKPANFLIVDGMLKLIDFGIANQMQPDVTSIIKDSQVGTVNYMPPESIKDLYSSDQSGKARSKISPKSDVWSLGCILYCMTYGRTPFQHITNQITKLQAIIDASYEIEYPPIPEMDLQDVLKKCLARNPKWRISIAELLVHPYVQIQPPPDQQMSRGTSEEVKRILGQLIGLNSPNSISRAARSLYEQCDSGRSLDVAAFAKPVGQKPWTMK